MYGITHVGVQYLGEELKLHFGYVLGGENRPSSLFVGSMTRDASIEGVLDF